MPQDRVIRVTDVAFNIYDVNLESQDYIAIKEELRSNDLLHPITVQDHSDNGPFTLIAGRKRLAAYIELKKETIKALVFESTLPEKTIKEMSLVENLKRYNLPWYEEVIQEKQLNDLRVAEHGARRSGQKTKEGWSPTDTARELNKSLGKVYEDLVLANALEVNPHLAKIKDRNTALRLVRVQAKRSMQEIEALLAPEFTMNEVFCGDSAEVLKEFPECIFDACITDPPWSEYRDESLTSPVVDIKPIIEQIYRVLKPEALVYWICSTVDFPEYVKLFKSLRFEVQKYPLIWKKEGIISHGLRPWEYARDYEPILLAAKGHPTIAVGSDLSSVFTFAAVHNTRSIHPNEKPLGLIERIIRDCSYPGSKLLDPFGGSGVVAEAAMRSGRHYVVIEKDYGFYTKIKERLNVLHSSDNSTQPTTL